MLVFDRRRIFNEKTLFTGMTRRSTEMTSFIYSHQRVYLYTSPIGGSKAHLTTSLGLSSVIRLASQTSPHVTLTNAVPVCNFHNGREKKEDVNPFYSIEETKNNDFLESIIQKSESISKISGKDHARKSGADSNGVEEGEPCVSRDSCESSVPPLYRQSVHVPNACDNSAPTRSSSSRAVLGRDGYEFPSLLPREMIHHRQSVITKRAPDHDVPATKKEVYKSLPVLPEGFERKSVQLIKAAEFPEKKRMESSMIGAISEISASLNAPLREVQDESSLFSPPQEDRPAATAAACALVLNSNTVVTPTIIKELSSFMMQNTVTDRIVSAKDSEIRALEGGDGENGVESNHWAVTPEEIVQFKRYLAERVSVPGAVKFKNPLSGLAANHGISLYQTGTPSDSGHVTRILNYMANRSQVVTTETLQDLMMCNISWQVALRIGQLYVSTTSPAKPKYYSSESKFSPLAVLPPIAMTNRMLAHIVLNSSRGGSIAEKQLQITAEDVAIDDEKSGHNHKFMLWETGLSLYSSYMAQGRGEELTLVSHAHAVSLLRSKFKYYGSTSPQRRNDMWNNALDLLENVNATLEVQGTSKDNLSSTRKKTQIKGEEGLYYISEVVQLLTELNRWDVALKAMSLANFGNLTDIESTSLGTLGGDRSLTSKTRSAVEEVNNNATHDGNYYADLFGSDEGDAHDNVSHSSTLSTVSETDGSSFSTSTAPSIESLVANTLLVHTPDTIVSGMIAAATGGSISKLFILYKNFKMMGYRYNHDYLSDGVLLGILAAISSSRHNASFPFKWMEAVFDDILGIDTEKFKDKRADPKVSGVLYQQHNISRHMSASILNTMQYIAFVSKSAMIPQVNEPDSSHWLRALTCFMAHEMAPPPNIKSTGIVNKMEGFERALGATLHIVARYESIQRLLMVQADHRSKVRTTKEDIIASQSPVGITSESFPSTAAICGKLRDYIETCYGAISIESALLSTKMLEISSVWPRNTDTHISWSQALALFHHNLSGSPLRAKRTALARHGACQALLNEVTRSNAYAEVKKDQESSHAMMPVMYQTRQTVKEDALSWVAAMSLLKGSMPDGRRCLYLTEPSLMGNPYAAALREAVLLTYADGKEKYGRASPSKEKDPREESDEHTGTNSKLSTSNSEQIHNRVINLLSLVPAKYIQQNLSAEDKQRMEGYLITAIGVMSGEEDVWSIIDRQRHRLRLSMLSMDMRSS